ncbi:isochorismatase family protein [Luedemannella helvata]|uniref:N-carbamoylsarcosine amidohydrolase n=1 Tax=Luedemannella helvata TaxID=349315 RepID=A0ABP4W6X4_9ACTN
MTSAWIDDVRARYAAGGLAGRLTPGNRPAVVVVDLQYGFTDPTCGPGFDLTPVVEATRGLLDAARAARVPVFFTTISFPGTGGVRTWLTKMPAMRDLRPGTPWVDIDHRLDRRPSEPVIAKQAASAFAHTRLLMSLRELDVDTLLLCGATTSGCVRASAVDACANDLPTFVVRECVGDREAGPHDAALLDLDAKYADVISLAEALAVIKGGTS